jgi:L-fucose dehydrogenase
MNLNIREKVIIVSGGAKGIGEGIVSQLALEGAFPVIIGRNAKDNELALEKVTAAGGFGFTVEAELSNPESSTGHQHHICCGVDHECCD